jgi:hypothetical protein
MVHLAAWVARCSISRCVIGSVLERDIELVNVPDLFNGGRGEIGE